jgi:hypothetical protein
MNYLNDYLSTLLAIIHRDGGHYEKEYGTEQAVTEAKIEVCRLQTENERLLSDITRIANRCTDIKEIMEGYHVSGP